MVEFCDLVGTGITPVSKKAAVKTKNLASALLLSGPALIKINLYQLQNKELLLTTYKRLIKVMAEL